MQYYTYAHSKPDGTIFYIGKGHSKRAYDLVKRNVYWKRLVEKHGIPTVEILAHWATEQEALDHEVLLISCFKDMGYELANLTGGGEGCTTPTEETKAKIAASLTGKKRPKELCEKLSKSHTGKKLSEKHKANISASCKNILRSEEVKKRMSLAQKARWAKIKGKS